MAVEINLEQVELGYFSPIFPTILILHTLRLEPWVGFFLNISDGPKLERLSHLGQFYAASSVLDKTCRELNTVQNVAKKSFLNLLDGYTYICA